MMPRTHELLVELLVRLFDENELRRFFVEGPRGEELRTRLPGPTASLFEIASKAVDLWDEYGCIGEPLFLLIREARPHSKAEIDKLRGACLSPRVRVWTRVAAALPWKRLVVLFVPCLVAWLDLASFLEIEIQGRLIAWTRGLLEPGYTVLLMIDPEKDAPRGLQSLRASYPSVLSELAEWKPKGILFDVSFSAQDPMDVDFSSAVRALEERGIPVILPVHLHNGVASPPGSPELARAGRLGLIDVERDVLFGRVRRARACAPDASGHEWWHSSVQMAAALGTGEPPHIEGRNLLVGGLRNPVFRERVYLPPATRVPTVELDDPGAWSSVARKVVIIGVLSEKDRYLTLDGRRYGAEIQALLVETLLQQKALPVVPTGWNILAALGTGLFMVAIGVLVPARRRWLVWIVPCAVLALNLALGLSGYLMQILPIGLGALAGFFVIRGHARGSSAD